MELAPDQPGSARRYPRPPLASLVSGDVTLHRGIPVTTPERTIADLREAISIRCSGAITLRELRKAVRQANVLGLPVGAEDAKARLPAPLRRYGVPRPQVNVPIGPYLVDFLWIDKRLVVETDSYLYHRGEIAFQDDHHRDLDLRRRGYDVIRLSERQIEEEPRQVAETLAATLSGG